MKAAESLRAYLGRCGITVHHVGHRPADRPGVWMFILEGAEGQQAVALDLLQRCARVKDAWYSASTTSIVYAEIT